MDDFYNNVSAPTTFEEAWKSDDAYSSEEDEKADSSFFGTRNSFLIPKNKQATIVPGIAKIQCTKPGSPFHQRSSDTNIVKNGKQHKGTLHKNKPCVTLETLNEFQDKNSTAPKECDDELSRARASSIPEWNPKPQESVAEKDSTAEVENSNITMKPVLKESVDSCQDKSAHLAPTLDQNESTSVSVPKAVVHFEDDKAKVSDEALSNQSNSTELAKQVATPSRKKKIPGYLRGTASSTGKRRGAQQLSVAKPAHKMSRISRTRSQRRDSSLASSTKKANVPDVRKQRREQAIRAASVKKKKSTKSRNSAVSNGKLRKLTQPVEFNFNKSRRRNASGNVDSQAGVAGINDPFSLGRSYSKTALSKAKKESRYNPAQLTKPQAFNLATASRANARKNRKNTAEPVIFKSTKEMVDAFQNKTPARFHSKSRLENKPLLPENFNPSLTVPDAPKLTANNIITKTVDSSEKSPFVPLVNRISAFHAATPDRFKSQARIEKQNINLKEEQKNIHNYDPSVLTVPVTPTFTTDARVQSKPLPKSTAELEAEYIINHAWKAIPVNKTALESTGDVGVPRILKKACTEIEGFKLSSTNRVAVPKQDTPVKQFKARKVNKSLLQTVQFQTHPSTKALTETASPQLLTQQRAAAKDDVLPVTYDTNFKARPVPISVYSKSKTSEHISVQDVTKIKEFSLQSLGRHEQYQHELKQKLEMQKNAELAKAEFKAQPIQYEDKFVCAKVEERPLTTVEEFRMPGQFFHEHAQLNFEKKVQDMKERDLHTSTFIARPAPTFKNTPVVPMSTKPLTNSYSPALASKSRAEQRKEFDAKIRKKAEEEEATRVAQEAAKKEAEAEEIVQIRKKMEFKARPIMHEDPNFSRKRVLTKSLTTPMSPNFATAKRAMLRNITKKSN